MHFLFGIYRLKPRLDASEKHFGSDRVLKDLRRFVAEEKLYGNAEIGAVRIKQLVLSVRIFFDFGRENGAVGPRGIGNFIGGVKPAVLCKGDVVSELFVVCFGVYGVDGGVFVPVGVKVCVTSRAARGKKNRASAEEVKISIFFFFM